MATAAQVKAFIDKISVIAIDVCKSKSRKILPSVCIAQCCHESGYGTSEKMIRANAILGIKVGKNKVHFGTAWKEKAYSTRTKECYDGKTYTEITAMFRAYDSLRDSIEDYYDMLGTCSRYKACIGVTDYKKCIKAIKDGGYATGLQYAEHIIQIIEKYNLTRFDECMTGTSKSDIPAAEDTNTGKFALGQKVKVTTYFSNSSSSARKVVSTRTVVVKRINSGSAHPYLVYSGTTPIGWTEEKYMSLTSTSTNDKYTYHTVVAGDTNSKIAKKYGITVANILSMNKSTYPTISAGFIRVGWKLRVK